MPIRRAPRIMPLAARRRDERRPHSIGEQSYRSASVPLTSSHTFEPTRNADGPAIFGVSVHIAAAAAQTHHRSVGARQGRDGFQEPGPACIGLPAGGRSRFERPSGRGAVVRPTDPAGGDLRWPASRTAGTATFAGRMDAGRTDPNPHQPSCGLARNGRPSRRLSLLWVASSGCRSIQADTAHNYSIAMFDRVAAQSVQVGVTTMVLRPPHTAPARGIRPESLMDHCLAARLRATL